ncbi:MAG TPA: enoyl-CoA hydratase-related protein [Actinomycetota bacterium]|nr:enoyl-CoA hydratase-related protein [Actinomycetota bacterium]
MPVARSVEDRVCTLVLDRPSLLNAFDDDLGFALLEEVTRAAEDDSVRCIVITGAGRAFSSGEDLGALAGGYEEGRVPDLGDTLTRRYNPLIRAVRAAPKPVVAAVNGVAAGAGASLALACDFRLASEHAKLVFAFVKVGLVPDSGAVWFLERMIGQGRALELVTSGRVVGAQEAVELGLFTEVVGAADFAQRWRDVARELASGPTRAFALTKALVQASSSRNLDDQLDAEVDAQAAAGRTADHLEGVQAFLGKRAAKFEGR